MRAVIVTGDRNAEFRTWVGLVDGELSRRTGDGLVVIHGDARGIDRLTDGRARIMPGVSVVPMPAQWDRDGKSAGPFRNAAMLRILKELRDVGYKIEVLAFHDDLEGSKGTKDMVAKARKEWIRVTVYASNGGKETFHG